MYKDTNIAVLKMPPKKSISKPTPDPAETSVPNEVKKKRSTKKDTTDKSTKVKRNTKRKCADEKNIDVCNDVKVKHNTNVEHVIEEKQDVDVVQGVKPKRDTKLKHNTKVEHVIEDKRDADVVQGVNADHNAELKQDSKTLNTKEKHDVDVKQDTKPAAKTKDIYFGYPFYKNEYHPTKERFFTLVKTVIPQIVDKIPQKMKFTENIVPFMATPWIVGSHKQYVLILEDWNKHAELNNTTDYFSEHVRIQCYFKDYIKPLEYWKRHRKRLLTEFANKTKLELRDRLYFETKFCNNFRISVALTVFALFKPRKVLDPSCGWGDRLLAAIGHGVDMYVGVDPNPALHPCYNEIINMFVDEPKRKNFITIEDGFEMADVPDVGYDLVFTSPPFFDLEVYSSSARDSINAYRTMDDWYDNFLLVMITKSYKLLKQNGHFILYIADTRSNLYVRKLVNFVNTIMVSNGSIYYYYEDAMKPRRMYVWTKHQIEEKF